MENFTQYRLAKQRQTNIRQKLICAVDLSDESLEEFIQKKAETDNQ